MDWLDPHVGRRRDILRNRSKRAIQRALLPASRPSSHYRRNLRCQVRSQCYIPSRLWFLHPDRKGPGELVLGDSTELAEPRFRSERSVIPESRRLQVDERQRRQAVEYSRTLVSQCGHPWRGTTAVQL